MSACGLIIAASYPILLEGLENKLRSEPGFSVISCCRTGAQVLHAVAGHRPDVLVLDLQIDEPDAFEVLRQLSKTPSPRQTRVVLLADRISDDEMLEATKLGVKGIVLKDMSGELLVRCIRKVHAGGSWFERQATARALDRLLRFRSQADRADGGLTDRQLEITRLAARGWSNKEIAARLAICEGTVKAHLHTVYEKLGLGGRVELALYAHRRALLSDVSSTER